MFGMKEGSQRIETYTIYCDPWVKTKILGFSTFTFCEELWPTIYGALLVAYYKARVQNGVSGSYMGAVFELVAHEESEIWISKAYAHVRFEQSLHSHVVAMADF